MDPRSNAAGFIEQLLHIPHLLASIAKDDVSLGVPIILNKPYNYGEASVVEKCFNSNYFADILYVDLCKPCLPIKSLKYRNSDLG